MTPRKWPTIGLLLLTFLCGGNVVLAQGSEAPRNQAVIAAPEDAPMGRPILLDASMSRIVGEGATYTWFARGIADPISRTVDAIYTPEQPGTLVFRLIVRSVVDGVPQEFEAVHSVTVYRRKAVLVVDSGVPAAKVEAQVRSASGAGLYVRVLRAPVPASSADAFTKFIADRRRSFQGAESIILWTDPVAGLQSLLQVMQGDAARLEELRRQSIVLIPTGRLSTVLQIARAPYAVLRPERIILLNPEALGVFLGAADTSSFLSSARDRDLPVATVDASTPSLPPWQPLSLLMDYMLVHGMGSSTLLLLLMLPVIATILSFLKQVVGFSTFGLYAPSIVALSFLALGWWTGLLFFLFILFAGIVSRWFVYRLHILYVPKVAIIITLVSLSLLILLALTIVFGAVLTRDTVFVLLIMATLAESFLTARSGRGWFSASSTIIQTIVASLLCVFVVQWSSFQLLLLAYPELLLLTILLNFLIGRYTGLRLSEYVRFHEVMKRIAAEE